MRESSGFFLPLWLTPLPRLTGMLKSAITFCLGEKEGHAHVGTCFLHLLNECVSGGTGRTDVVNQQDTLAVEVVGVYLHIALLVVPAADMHFLTLADNLDMLEAIDSLALLTYACRETLVTALVGLLNARPVVACQSKNWRGCTR